MKRLWDKVLKTDSCWIWVGNTDKHGYGRIGIGSRVDNSRKTVLAHRLAYEILRGKIGEGMYLCHKCDNPSCVNPDHLFEGTQLDNCTDMAKKGRGHKGYKLNDSDIHRIISMKNDGMRVTEIGRQIGVSHSMVSMILSGRRWNRAAIQ